MDLISYRATLKIHDDTILFYVRAESCRKAVGKMFLDMKESIFEDNIITVCQQVLSKAISDDDNDHLVYESEEFTLECSRNPTIVPDKIDEEDPFLQEMQYILKNLPPHLGNTMNEFDVYDIINFRDEFMEHNCIYFDEDGNETDYGDEDETRYFRLDLAAEYIRKRIIEEYEEPAYPITDIQTILITASEYNYTLKQVLRKNNDTLSAIDISGISSN